MKTVAGKLDIYETFLNDGAAEKSVKDITEVTGLEVPDALVELLLRHNGEKKFLGFLGHGFLSTGEIISQWQTTGKIMKQMSSILQKSTFTKPGNKTGLKSLRPTIPKTEADKLFLK